MQAAAVRPDPCRRPVPLEVVERCRHVGVGFEVAVVADERPEHAHRLRRRERRVESGHRPHDSTILRHPIDELHPERCPSDWVAALEQCLQLVSGHWSGKPEQIRLSPGPYASLLPRRLRQVLRVVARRCRCRRCVERRHPQHDNTPPPVGTCLFSKCEGLSDLCCMDSLRRVGADGFRCHGCCAGSEEPSDRRRLADAAGARDHQRAGRR